MCRPKRDDLSTLEMSERVTLDREPIEKMCEALGAERAERLVGGAMEEMAVWLTRAHPLLRSALASGEAGELGRLAQRIAPVAEQLGMPQLSRIATEVRALSLGRDMAALAAVTGRMVRVGEASLVAIWDLQDISV